jgi:Peptidase family M23
MKQVYTLFISLLFFHYSTEGQQQEKYLFPIQPGVTASLAGTLGELRSNHFHTGIDIRTNNEVGYAVYATQRGYVSRVAMSAGGYGNVLYITHPDGNTSVYAHLDSFKKDVADYVRQEQYRRKTFEIELFFRADQFTVKQGDVIAVAGNTGSSSGPHLHFDIRNKDNVALDPLTFGFREVVDTLPPYTEKIALKTMNMQSRINDRFGRFEFYVVRKGADFEIPVPILASGLIGVEIIAKDKMAYKSPFFGGVNFIEVFENDQLVFKQAITQLNLTEGRAINSMLSFRSLRGSNSKFYKLYVDDGNTLDFYMQSQQSGKISINTLGDRVIKIVSRDVFGNKSTLSFTLRRSEPVAQLFIDAPIKQPLHTEILDNTLKLTINKTDNNDTASAYINGRQVLIKSSYSGKYTNVFLIDLKKYLPDSICIGKEKYVGYFKTTIPPNNTFTFYGKNVDVTFPKGSLYDTLYYQQEHYIRNDSTEILRLGDVFIPLHKNINVVWVPTKLNWDNSSAVYKVVGNDLSYVGGSYTNGRIAFSIREFGSYTIGKDTIPPTIKAVSLNSVAVRFKIKDDMSGIDSYEASINGQWLLMHLDGKSGTLRAEPLNTAQKLRGELSLTVIDRAGNRQTFKQIIP